MCALQFVLFAYGGTDQEINILLDSYDQLADYSVPNITKAKIRRILSAAIRETPQLGVALRSARKLGSSGGRSLPTTAQELLDARQYSSEDVASINAVLEEGIAGPMALTIPYYAPPNGPGSRTRKNTRLEDLREDRVIPSHEETRREKTANAYNLLVAALMPQGYTMKEIAAMWNTRRQAEDSTPARFADGTGFLGLEGELEQLDLADRSAAQRREDVTVPPSAPLRSGPRTKSKKAPPKRSLSRVDAVLEAQKANAEEQKRVLTELAKGQQVFSDLVEQERSYVQAAQPPQPQDGDSDDE